MFEDRIQAGERLAGRLEEYKNDKSGLVLALPRGGVEIGAKVAECLNLPLDVVMVRKIGHRGYPEYAIGAIVEDEPAIYNEREAALTDKDWLKQAEEEAHNLIKKRVGLYFDKKRRKDIKGKTTILVDDGIATGFTMEVAIKTARNKGAKKIIIAVPVAPEDTIERLKRLADSVVVVNNPKNFLGAVGSHYYKFNQVSDDEVKALLMKAG